MAANGHTLLYEAPMMAGLVQRANADLILSMFTVSPISPSFESLSGIPIIAPSSNPIIAAPLDPLGDQHL